MGLIDRITSGDNTVVQMADYAQPRADDLDGTYRASAASYGHERAITAAAKRINLNNVAEAQEMADRPYAAWQDDAWMYHDAVGEVNYGHEMLASIMSRLRLYPALAVDPDAPPTSTVQLRRRILEQTDEETQHDKDTGLNLTEAGITEEVMDAMEEFAVELGSGLGGVAGLLRMFTLNIMVPGECYLARIDNRWSIRSTSEITIRAADQKAILQDARLSRSPNGMPWRELDKSTYVARIWRPHPRWSKEPTSAMVALLEPCDELLTLQRMIRGIARSRMNAGILFVPDGLTVSSVSPNNDKEEAEAEETQFMEELFDSMTAPITDETSGSGVVPMVITGPKDLGKEIRWISFVREADQWLVRRADSALERVLNGLNIPKEMVSGLDQVRYTNANQVSENLYKIHIEPLAVMLCDALSSVYFRARLKARFPNLDPRVLAKAVIWYDPTEVVIRPDPAESATEGYNLQILSGDTWRRSHGYADTDAPSQKELAARMALELGKNLPPEVQSEFMHRALPELFSESEGSGDPSPLRATEAPQEDRYGPTDAVTSEVDDVGAAEVTT